MPDLRMLLDEVTGDLIPRGDELRHTIDLAQRRARKARRQRLMAAGLAMVIGAAGIAVAARTFAKKSTPPPRPASYGNGVIGFVGISHPVGHFAGDLYTVNPDGSGLSRLTRSVDVTVNVHFSPDGRRIVFARSTGKSEWTIAVMNADGTGRRQITGGPPAERPSPIDEFPSWLPDGRIAFFRNAGGGPGQGMWVVNADGSGARLVAPGWVPFEAAVSPDGSQVVWMGDRGTGTGGEDLFVAHINGSHRRRLTSDPATAGMPAWSTDGARIVFMNGDAIQVIGSDGSGRRTLFRCTGSCEGAGWPTWSPDGRKIVFTVVHRSAGNPVHVRSTDLIVMNQDGTGIHVVASVPFDACCPTWQPVPR